MILKETLRKIILSQKDELSTHKTTKRKLLSEVDLNLPHVAVISGIRCCGKSTLMMQLMNKVQKYYYFNFEDQRALNFDTASDFEKLNEVFEEEFGQNGTFFLMKFKMYKAGKGLFDENKIKNKNLL